MRRSQGLRTKARALSRPSCLQEFEKENEELDTRHSVFLRFVVGCREGLSSLFRYAWFRSLYVLEVVPARSSSSAWKCSHES